MSTKRRYLCWAEVMENAISEAHKRGGHLAHRSTYKRLAINYTHITRPIVKEFVDRCQFCVDRKKINRKKLKKPLNPIIADGMFSHLVMDLVDYSSTPGGKGKNYNYLFHLIDHQSSFHFTNALKHKSAEEVWVSLRQAFAVIGFPSIIHSDNGGEFKNTIVEEYLNKYKIKFVHGKPYRPQTQGKIERNNQTIERIIDGYIAEAGGNWYDVYSEATIALNTNFSSTTKVSPYKFVFNQDPRNSGDIEELLASLAMTINDTENENVIAGTSEMNIIDLTLSSSINEESKEENKNETESIIESSDNDKESSNIPENPIASFEELRLFEDEPSLSAFPSSENTPEELLLNSNENENHAMHSQDSELEESKEENLEELEKLCSQSIQAQNSASRDVAVTNYKNNAKKMKEKHDRLLQATQTKFAIGATVGITIPGKIMSNNVRRLPAVVYEIIENTWKRTYKLGSMGHIIQGVFDPSELTEVSYSTFASVLKLSESSAANGGIVKNWAKFKNGKPRPQKPLVMVYKLYLKQHYLSQQSSTETQSQRKRKRSNCDVEHASQKKKLLENQCAACFESLPEESFHQCAVCCHRVHNNIVCPAKQNITIKEQVDGPPLLYCSPKCLDGVGEISNSTTVQSSSQDQNSTSSFRKPIPDLKIGGVVQLIVSQELLGDKNKEAKIPVVILERDYDYDEDEYIFSVAVKNHTILGWFKTCELETYARGVFMPKSVFGITGNTRITQSKINSWGYDSMKNLYQFVTLEEAYEQFIDKGNYNGTFKNVIYQESND